MRTIHKFELRETVAAVTMPRNAHIICVQSQADEPWQKSAICIWAEVDDEVPCEIREFRIISTGDKLPSSPLRYIGSCMVGKTTGEFKKPVYVVHVYEEYHRREAVV